MEMVTRIRILLMGVAFCSVYACDETSSSGMEDSEPPYHYLENNVDDSQKEQLSLRQSEWSQEIGAPIPYDTALSWTARFKARRESKVLSHFFGRSTFKRILSNSKVVGISIQYAVDDRGQPQLVLVGVDRNGKIVAQSFSRASADPIQSYEDMSRPCPPLCPE